MPLLGKEPFVKVELPQDIDLDSEIFYCKTTHEAFTTFDQFFERAILCSSMVWTCSVTGRTGLTFEEALESEEKANNMLTSFPSGLQLPVLYLIKYMNESKFGKIINMIYAFIDDRFFVGEEVFANVGKSSQKKLSKIIRVIFQSDNLKSSGDASQQPTVSFGPDPSLYKYEVQQIDDGSTEIVGSERVIRSKSLVTKEKIRLFLKQHLTALKRFQPMVLKDESIISYNIDNTKWDDIFAGPVPNFNKETVIVKTLNKDKKKLISEQKKESREKKKLKKNKLDDKKKKKELTPEEKQKLKEELKQKRLEERRLEKERLKEKKKQIEEQMKEWNAKRDDLACDDLKPLPKPSTVDCDIPMELFDQAVAIIEFFHDFNELIDLSSIFSNGFTFELLCQVLVKDKESKGPFSELIKLLLQKIFMLQDEEDKTVVNIEKDKEKDNDNSDEDNSQDEDEKEEKDSVDKEEDKEDKDDQEKEEDKDNNVIKTAMKNANNVLNYIHQHYNCSLSEIEINSQNVIEILRLHLATAGSGLGKPRSKHRGGFTQNEDPCLWFVINNNDLFKKLESTTIDELTIKERIQLIQVLIDEMITFIPFRNFIEDAFVQIGLCKRQIRDLQAAFTKWIRENSVKKSNTGKKDLFQSVTDAESENNNNNNNNNPSQEQIEEFKREKAKKEDKLQKQCMDLRSQIRKYQSRYGLKPIGLDRAFRKYFIFESLPGLFIEHCESNEHYGLCLDDPTPLTSTKPRSLDELKGQQRKNENSNLTNDKNNDYDSSVNSDKENDASLSEDRDSFISNELKDNNQIKLSVFDRCSGDLTTCYVHGTFSDSKRIKWTFYHSREQFDTLVKSLNNRGYRESELRSKLLQDKQTIYNLLSKCPAHSLNRDISPSENHNSKESLYIKNKKSCSLCHKYDADWKCSSCLKFYHFKCLNNNSNGYKLCFNCDIYHNNNNTIVEGKRIRKRPNYGEDFDEVEFEVKRSKRINSKYSKDYDYVNGHLITSDSEDNDTKEKKKGLKEEVKKEIKKEPKKRDKHASNEQNLPLDFSMCEDILKKLQKYDDSWQFYKHPTRKVAPNYKTAIKRHIDFGLLSSKLNTGTYRSNTEFFKDIFLMLENCRIYWPSTTIEYKAGQSTAEYFDELLQQYNITLI